MRYLFVVLLLLVNTLHIQAQELSKEEKKALIAEIEAFMQNPDQFKAFKVRQEDKRKQAQELDNQVKQLDQVLSRIKATLAQKNDRIKELGDEIARLELENKERKKAIESHSNDQGLIYKVQIEVDESFLYQEVDPVTGKRKVVINEAPDEDGIRKYTLGYFSDKEEAQTFSKYLQLLRVRGAIVVTYKDGRKL